jgi:hypothetical protein
MANIKISQLPALATLADTTVFSTVNAGANYKMAGSIIKSSISQLTNGSYTAVLGSDGVLTLTGAIKASGLNPTITNGDYSAFLNGSGLFSSSAFLASEGSSNAGNHGYSFTGDGGYDTGMFSSGDGYLQFYSNNNKVIEVNPTGSITSFLQPIVVKDVRDTVYAATFASTFTPDAANGSIQNITLTGSITINAFANPVAGQTITLILTQGGSGSYTLTSTMKFAGGLKTLSTAVGSVDMLTITYTGSVYYASLITGFV